MRHTVTTQKALLCHPQCARAGSPESGQSHLICWPHPGKIFPVVKYTRSSRWRDSFSLLSLKKRKYQKAVFKKEKKIATDKQGISFGHLYDKHPEWFAEMPLLGNLSKPMKGIEGRGYNNTHLCLIPALGRYRQEGDEVKAWTTEHQPVSNSKCKQMKNKVAEGGDTDNNLVTSPREMELDLPITEKRYSYRKY